MITVVGVYVVRIWRDHSGDDHVSVNDLLTNYREMHSRGDITDAEFRTIKTALKDKLERELSDSGHDD